MSPQKKSIKEGSKRGKGYKIIIRYTGSILIAIVSPSLFIIAVKVDGLNFPITRHRVA